MQNVSFESKNVLVKCPAKEEGGEGLIFYYKKEFAEIVHKILLNVLEEVRVNTYLDNTENKGQDIPCLLGKWLKKFREGTMGRQRNFNSILFTVTEPYEGKWVIYLHYTKDAWNSGHVATFPLKDGNAAEKLKSALANKLSLELDKNKNNL